MRENELANVSRNFSPRPSEWSVETIERVRTSGLLSSHLVPVQQLPGPIDSRGRVFHRLQRETNPRRLDECFEYAGTSLDF
jgi:hypothetical protein